MFVIQELSGSAPKGPSYSGWVNDAGGSCVTLRFFSPPFATRKEAEAALAMARDLEEKSGWILAGTQDAPGNIRMFRFPSGDTTKPAEHLELSIVEAPDPER